MQLFNFMYDILYKLLGELIDEPFVRLEKTPEPVVRVREGESVTLGCEAIGKFLCFKF